MIKIKSFVYNQLHNKCTVFFLISKFFFYNYLKLPIITHNYRQLREITCSLNNEIMLKFFLLSACLIIKG